MQFASPYVATRQMPSVMPLLGVSLLPALLVLAMVCFSLSREEQLVRLPTGTLPRPPAVRATPQIAVRLSRQGAVTLAGQAIADDGLAAAWQRERGALRLLDFEPSAATVVVRADPDVPTDKVQRLMEKAQEAGFSQFVLRGAEDPRPKTAANDARPADFHQLPAVQIRLRADAAGHLASIAFNGRPVKDVADLPAEIRAFLGPAAGEATVEAQLDCDGPLRYEHTQQIITALSACPAADGRTMVPLVLYSAT